MKTHETTLDDVAPELYRVQSTIALAAFSSEALRVLNAIYETCAAVPELERLLDKHIDAWREWRGMPDTSSQVLSAARDSLDAILSHL